MDSDMVVGNDLRGVDDKEKNLAVIRIQQWWFVRSRR